MSDAELVEALENIADGSDELDDIHMRIIARAALARHRERVAALGIIRSHASDEHVQNYQRAIMLCDAALNSHCGLCGLCGTPITNRGASCSRGCPADWHDAATAKARKAPHG